MRNARSRRVSAPVALVLLVASACGGSKPSPDASKPLVVTSEDGLLSVEIPRAVVPDEEVTVRTLTPEELPEELKGFKLKGAVHDLGPDGAQFSEPVTVRRRVNIKGLGLDPSEGVPIITLFSRDSEGTWSLLEDQSVTSEGEQAVATGTTTHFSTVAAFGGSIQLSMRPDDVTREVGESWDSLVYYQEKIALARKPTIHSAGAVGSKGVLEVGRGEPVLGAEHIFQQTFACAAPGEDSFSVVVTLTVREVVGDLADILASLLFDVGTTSQKVVIPGQALCTGVARTTEPPKDPTIERACAYWEHEGEDTLYAILAEVPSAEPGETATVRAEGVNSGKPITAAVEQDDQGWFLRFIGRIKTYGPHPILDLSYEDSAGEDWNFTDQIQRLLGNGEVDSKPKGWIGKDCGQLERLIP